MENLPSPSCEAELNELRTQCHQLQQLLSSLLLVLIIVSATLSVFLNRQYRFVKSELDSIAPQAAQLWREHTNNFAATQDFAKKLAEYGRTHPDFAPIVDKYRLNDLLVKPGMAPITSSLPSSSTNKK